MYFNFVVRVVIISCGGMEGVLQKVGCLGEGRGPSWANVEGWYSSTFPQAPSRVVCRLGKW